MPAPPDVPKDRRPAHAVGIPLRPFLYTLDQIAGLLEVSLARLEAAYVYFDGRSVGGRKRDLMLARNIAPQGERPDWRVTEQELTRWLRYKRFRVYEKGWLRP